MPSNVGPAFGVIAETLGKRFREKADQEYEQKTKRNDLVWNLISAGLRSGTIKNPQEAFQFGMESIGGGGKGQGKAGKGGGKGDLPGPLKALVGGLHHIGQQGDDKTLGGQDKPAFSAPGSSAQPPQFFTPDELQQRETTAERTKGQIQAETAGATTGAQLQAKQMFADRLVAGGMERDEADERAGLKAPVPKAPTADRDLTPDPASPTGFSRQYHDAKGGLTRTEPAVPSGSAGGVKPASLGEFFLTREKELGVKRGGMSTIQQAQARRDYMSGLTPDQKMAQAKSLATFRYNVGAPDPEDMANDAQSIRLGDQDVPFVTTEGFTGKEKGLAKKAASKAGITVVTRQQADQLAAANTAIGSLNTFFQSVKDKLPADAKARPLAQIEIPLKQMFQTDEDLASAVAWNITVLPQLRAMAITGRVPVFEYQQALNAQPKLTDTVGTAAKKMAIVKGVLERGAHSVLDRGGKIAGAKPTNAIPDDVKTALKSQPNGRRYRVGGIIYNKLQDGSIEPAPATQ